MYAFNTCWGSASLAPPDPFSDTASGWLPDAMPLAIRWSRFLLNNQGPYRQALRRVLSYFITEIVISGKVSSDEKEHYKNYLDQRLGMALTLRTIGEDFLITNNAFVSVYRRFDRFIVCPQCGHQVRVGEARRLSVYEFRWENWSFQASCPGCNYQGDWGKPNDIMRDDVYIKRWNPDDIEIESDEHGFGGKRIRWRIPPEYRKQVAIGIGSDEIVLDDAPWDVIQACKNGMDIYLNDANVCHLSVASLAGMRTGGWGIPDPIINFRQSWRTALVERYNEAIIQDYITPLRVIMPGEGGGASNDPVAMFSMSNFVARTYDMLRRRSLDPDSWFVSSVRMDYKALGGDARELAPKDLLDQSYEMLFNAAGVPIELFKGSLSTKVEPAALRLMESAWTHVVHALNQVLDFIGRRLSMLLAWPRIQLKLKTVTLVDDLQKIQARMQLLSAGKLSDTSALEMLGADFAEELRRKKDEQKRTAEIEEEYQEEMQGKSQAQQMAQPQQQGQPGQQGQPAQPGQPGQAPPGAGAGAAPGGAPDAAAQGAGPGGAPTPAGQAGMAATMQSPLGQSARVSIPDLMTYAKQKAGEILAMPQSQRQSAMMQLKKENETLWMLVRAQVDQVMNKAKTVGAKQVIQQQFGGQAA